ncbi:hypothetical protein CQ015_07190 [Arthrobacter sp. MYb221]|uniref:hypothetical protein n=1 Tax=unclassified Arthrobacter TaxID=235627 RepID=UPI000CFA9E24|nr:MULTISPECIES: hypothetical protein [unclassified Arthrobacter]PRA12296.1 hypothetical protein CQ015_07190 [Arthrobacter sp. MYb221]
MSQAPPDPKARHRGIGYSLLYPAGWREFNTSVEHEQALTKLVTAEPKALGRVDLVLMLRQKMHQMFEYLRRRGSLGFAMPVEKLSSGAMPVSVIMTPLKVGTTGSLLDAARRAAGGSQIEIEDADGAEWYLWTSSEQSDEAPELKNKGLNLVVPRPKPDGSLDPDPKAGLWLLFSYSYVDSDNGEEFAEGLRTLGYAILGTFKWVPIQ